jgi:chromosome segregation ATPase
MSLPPSNLPEHQDTDPPMYVSGSHHGHAATTGTTETEIRQILSLLEEKQCQIETLHQQLARERQRFREKAEEIKNQWEEVSIARQTSNAERERLREFRVRFLKRLRRQWHQARREINRQRQEFARQKRLLEIDRAELQQQQIQLQQEWQSLEHQREELTQQKTRWDQLQRETEEIWTQRKHELTLKEAALEESQQALALAQATWTNRLTELREESRGLEQRIAASRRLLAVWKQQDSCLPPAPPACEGPSEPFSQLLSDIPIAERPALEEYYRRCQEIVRAQWAAVVDQRQQLAELWQRLTEAELAWQNDQQRAVREMERLCAHLTEQEERLQAQRRNLETQREAMQAERLRLQERRQELEHESAQIKSQKMAFRAEAARRELDLLRREQDLKRREEAIGKLFHRWRERRHEEIAQLRRHLQVCVAARDSWVEARDEALRRTETLRISQQALAEQALALEEVRQSLLKESPDSDRTARRIEKYRKRWEQAGAPSRRALERFRQQLTEEDKELRHIFLELEQEREALSREAAHLQQCRCELEYDRLHLEQSRAAWQSERETWWKEREIWQQHIAELQAELHRLTTRVETAPDHDDQRAAA